MKIFVINCILMIFVSSNLYSEIKEVLFLGNSYTFYNNLPQMVADVSESTGKTINFISSTPGGESLQGHLQNDYTMSLIREGAWDIVILQEQSQIPTIDYYRYNSMYPAAISLADSIRKYNDCATIITYMTWGRKNGGRLCDMTKTHCSPDFKDFSHMQDSLKSAYLEISDIINATISPIGIAWENALQYQGIVLHDADESHPNYHGSFLAACVLYGSIWNDSPLNINTDMLLDVNSAYNYKFVADETLFKDSISWNMHLNYPVAQFSYLFENDTLYFTNESLGGDSLEYYWNFGDGNTSILENPTHKYFQEGVYEISLIVSFCNKKDTSIIEFDTSLLSIPDKNEFNMDLKIFPNPASTYTMLYVFSDIVNITEVTIFDIWGKIIFNMDYSDIRGKIIRNIDVSHLASGIYYVWVISDISTKVEKLVIL